jgi:hypothetical protein
MLRFDGIRLFVLALGHLFKNLPRRPITAAMWPFFLVLVIATPCVGDAFDDAMVLISFIGFKLFLNALTPLRRHRVSRKAYSLYRIQATGMHQGTLCST